MSSENSNPVIHWPFDNPSTNEVLYITLDELFTYSIIDDWFKDVLAISYKNKVDIYVSTKPDNQIGVCIRYGSEPDNCLFPFVRKIGLIAFLFSKLLDKNSHG